MRNPFRGWGWTRRSAERRDLGPGDVSWPVEPLASPGAVTEDGALRLAPVFAAGRLLASKIAGLPLEVYRKTGDQPEKLPLPNLFAQPSATGTPYHWTFRTVTSLAYRGNAVGLVTHRNALEYPTFIEWLNPADVSVQDSNVLGTRGSFTDPVWSYLGVEIPSEDIVHIPWFTLPGRVWGLSPIAAYAVTVSTGLAAHKFSDDWFRSGGVPPGRFKNAVQTVNQGEANVIKRRLVQAIRSHEPIVYGKDWDYEPITISQRDAQFIETLRLGATEIAAIYGIPPEMIGGETGGSMSYSSPEQRQLELVQFSLDPWLRLLEPHLSMLLPRSQYVQFNADAIIRADIKTRYQVYTMARRIGTMSRDEIRIAEDQPPLPNGEGRDFTPQTLLEAMAKSSLTGDPRISDGDTGLGDGADDDLTGQLHLIRPDQQTRMDHG